MVLIRQRMCVTMNTVKNQAALSPKANNPFQVNSFWLKHMSYIYIEHRLIYISVACMKLTDWDMSQFPVPL